MSAGRRTLLWGLLGAAGLVLYLWPALVAPVVVSSDSEIDLAQAREGSPIGSVPGQLHAPKPGYVLFLMAARRLAPGLGEARSVAVVQAVLAWAAILGAGVLMSRRGRFRGMALTVVLFLFLRVRDASSALHSDALAAALCLVLLALLLRPPRRAVTCGLAGAGFAFLFLVRPNVGGIAILVATTLFLAPDRRRKLWAMLAGIAVVMIPAWLATRQTDAFEGGLGAPLLLGSATYYWIPSPSAEDAARSGDPVGSAVRNWRAFFADFDGDRRRELVWRAFHGLYGTEFYDSRWSPAYAKLDDLSRRLSPLLVMAAIAWILVARFETGAEKAASVLLVLLLVAHDLAFGSHPRYILPFLPALFLLAVAGASSLDAARRKRAVLFASLFVVVQVALVRAIPGLVDAEWGLVEQAGVRISQTIPRGALPERPPATFHVRIATPVLPTEAGLEVFGPGGIRLYSSADDPHRERPAITLALPDSVLEANRRGPVAIDLVSTGRLDAFHFLLFPVVPRPWAAPAHRAGARELSPGTGISSGSLDWWAHEGFP